MLASFGRKTPLSRGVPGRPAILVVLRQHIGAVRDIFKKNPKIVRLCAAENKIVSLKLRQAIY